MGKHRWMAFVPYEVTIEDGLRIVGELPSPPASEVPHTQLAGDEVPDPADARPFLGLHNVVQELVTVGCFECEQPLTRATANAECAGDPGGKLAHVDVEGRDLHPGEGVVLGGNVGATGDARMAFGPVGRNDLCPCGSGLKWKKCHGG